MELIILEESTKAVNFGFGYDPDVELDYIYSQKRGEFDIKNAGANLKNL